MTDPLKCAACKRRLKRPTATGLGPKCERRLKSPPRPSPAPVKPDPEAGPGQTELPLYDHQPTLWSL